jgi:hypothetical protein
MKRILICAALLGACAQPPAEVDAGPAAELAPVTLPVADQAGNRMEAMTATDEGSFCTADNAWCVRLSGETSIIISGSGANPVTAELPSVEDAGSAAIWPNIVRNADGSAVIGVGRTRNQMYSGGGGQAAEINLYAVANGAADAAGTLPHDASKMIRACFDEDDQANRRGACHDEYAFETRISLNEGAASGQAQIFLETVATTYPGQIDINSDSTTAPPLQASDLVRWVDRACTYRRTYIRGADGAYAPDQRLPDCSTYLEP